MFLRVAGRTTVDGVEDADGVYFYFSINLRYGMDMRE